MQLFWLGFGSLQETRNCYHRGQLRLAQTAQFDPFGYAFVVTPERLAPIENRLPIDMIWRVENTL